MITRDLCKTCIAVVVLAVGCVNQPKPNQTVEPSSGVEPYSAPRQSPPRETPPGVHPDQMEASIKTPDVLARRAQEYSRQMETLLATRTQHEPAPSQVQWVDPSEFRLGDTAPTLDRPAPDRAQQPTVQPVIETAPGEANQLVTTTSPQTGVMKASANVPARADEPATRPVTGALSTNAPISGSLGQRLATRIREYPRDVSAQLEYQLLQLLLDEQVPQLAALAALPTEDRELITVVLDGISLFRSTLRSDNNMLLSKKIRPLLDMADRLRSQADLVIPTVVLCRSVRGFGDYDAIEPARFIGGNEAQAILYCEIANFSANLNDRQQWETRLKQELVLYTEFGVPVWSDTTATIKDTARARRHDFFVNKRITFPRNLTMGRYLLKVSIIDLGANRVAEATVPIVIAAQ